MKKIVMLLVLSSFFIGVLAIEGCTQMPTEKQSISDIRPQISFKTSDSKLHTARVILDGLDMGAVENYFEGSAALRILSGTHVLSLALGDRIVFDEKFYIGDGVNRTFIVK